MSINYRIHIYEYIKGGNNSALEKIRNGTIVVYRKERLSTAGDRNKQRSNKKTK